jgi:hypothetical protein
MARRKRATVKYCGKHGRFKGRAWCGHRRYCKSREVSRAEWQKLNGRLPAGRPSKISKATDMRKEVRDALEDKLVMTEIELAKVVVDANEINQRMGDLESVRDDLKKQIKKWS